MNLRNKRRELQGLVGAIGVVLGLAGYMTPIYSPVTATLLMIAVFMVGITAVNVFTDPPK